MASRYIFLLHEISLDDQVDEDFSKVPGISPEMDLIADIHLIAFKTITESLLNRVGEVSSIFMYFGDRGLFEFYKPGHEMFLDITPLQFKNLLCDMFLNEEALHPVTGEGLARRVRGVETLIASLPPNCRKIGHNPSDISATLLENSISEDDKILFVVGKLEDSEIERELDEVIKVSEFALREHACLGIVVQALERKLRI